MAADGRQGEPGGHSGAAPAGRLTLLAVEGSYAVCRLRPDAPWPAWAAGGPFVSVTRTADEVSVVCRREAVPPGVRHEPGWRCLRVAGTLDFGMVGVLAGLVGPLAAAGVSVFAASTFDTDYLLVKNDAFGLTVEVLRQGGHDVRE